MNTQVFPHQFVSLFVLLNGFQQLQTDDIAPVCGVIATWHLVGNKKVSMYENNE
jgi:hypothetical protein